MMVHQPMTRKRCCATTLFCALVAVPAAAGVLEFVESLEGPPALGNPRGLVFSPHVLDGCTLNDRFWVFAAATTNVEYTLRVTDTRSGAVQEYTNPLGFAAEALTDTDAFATCHQAP